MSRAPQITIKAIPLLISEVKKRRCLWDIAHEHYHNRYDIGLAWKQIAKKLKTSEYRAKMKWKNLRDTFFRNMKRSRETSEFPVKWMYYNDMTFLIPSADLPDNDYGEEYLNSDDSKPSFDDDKRDDETSNRSKDCYDDDSGSENEKITSDPSFNNSQTSSPAANQSLDFDEEHDLMFLESLAPFFCKLDPIRKLTLRSRIQDMLLHEVVAQREHTQQSSDTEPKNIIKLQQTQRKMQLHTQKRKKFK